MEPGHPEFRVRGPVDESHRGEIDDPDPAPDDPDTRSGVTGSLNENDGHVTPAMDWSDGDGDDPDGGSGRTWD